ncbi:MAG: NADH-quinone oxidoreductase subunit NuoG [Candidatus Eiseniibacteriota bacterium]
MSATCRVDVNGIVVEVPAGTLVTDAATAAGIHVPIFCSHSKLPPLGACRICVVEVGTPRLGPDRKPVLAADGTPEIAWMPKVQTGCTTPVSDGMHVRTESPAAVTARKGVMEFLLVNHPLDCPVCDEGGECQLQDLAFAFGADFSRMSDAKRTFVSEDLGPIVKKEANRCIMCMRCVRYCDEIMGEDALTAHQRGVRSEISSFNRQPLECEQCGNCIEVCPVGALTALPYRFKARPWDLRQHVTVCPYCSNGCSVRLGVRGMEILRARGTEARGVNQEFLCARGRFGYEFVQREDRLTTPLMRSGGSLAPAGFDEAVTYVAARLREIASTHGPGSIAFLGGEKLNLEEQYLFQKLARGVLGTSNIDARTRHTARVSGDAVLRATGGGRPLITLEEIGRATEVLVLCDDLQGEAPLAQAVVIRGQHQNQLHVTVAHPRRVKLARAKFGGAHLAVRPGGELALMMSLAVAALEAGTPEGLPADVTAWLAKWKSAAGIWAPEKTEGASGVAAVAVRAAAKRLREAPHKAVLFGRAILEHAQAADLLAAIEALGWASGAITSQKSAVMFLGPQHNSQGALDMALTPDGLPGYVSASETDARRAFEQQWGGVSLDLPAGLSAPEVLEAAAAGRVRALWIVSDEWLSSAPDRALAERAIERCDLVVVNEMFATETARRAHVVFPVSSFAEKEGTVVNCERRLQRSVRALSPRRGARADWEVFAAVACGLGAAWSYRTPDDVLREIARLVPGYQGVNAATMIPAGARWQRESPLGCSGRAPASALPANGSGEGLSLLAGGTLFLQGSLSRRSATLLELAGTSRAFLHPDEARRLSVRAGERIAISGSAGSVELPVAIDDAVPPGSVFVPYAQAQVQLNRLGAANGAGARVRVTRAAAQTVGA